MKLNTYLTFMLILTAMVMYTLVDNKIGGTITGVLALIMSTDPSGGN